MAATVLAQAGPVEPGASAWRAWRRHGQLVRAGAMLLGCCLVLAGGLAAQQDHVPAEDRARILARIGDTDEALAEIGRLLAGPSWTSVPGLLLEPHWDPLRDDPRFQALLVKYANPERVH